MTGLRLELGNPNAYKSPAEYIEKHLAPVVTELHRITSELLSPGATSAEEWAVDMVPGHEPSPDYKRFAKAHRPPTKAVVFDGAEYFSIPKALLRSKQLKVQLSALVAAEHGFNEPSEVAFRLVRDDGEIIDGSGFRAQNDEFETFVRMLPFGEQSFCIAPARHTYFLEGKSLGSSIPVCRRFSLSFIYI